MPRGRTMTEPTERKPLGRFVEAPIDDLKLRRQWRSISRQLGASGRASGFQAKRAGSQGLARWVFAGAGLAAVAAALFVLVPSGEPAAPVQRAQAVLETKNDSTQVALADGSSIDLQPQSRLEMKRETKNSVELVLQRGKARFDVAHVEGRRFAVVAANVRVHVVGTKFDVGVDDQEVRVAVQRGAVDVVVDGAATPVRLTAGQSWSLDREPPAAPPVTEEAPATSRKPPSDDSLTEGSGPRPTAPTAVQLFQKGNRLRSQADFAGAAQTYRDFLARFPGDPRSGLVAYELARLQMDRLGDYSGAKKNLARALDASPGGSIREGAMARLVRIHEATGATKQCLAAKQAYLAQYPTGAYHERVSHQCGGVAVPSKGVKGDAEAQPASTSGK